MAVEYRLRQDVDQSDLYVMGPYEYGAEQLRVNGYTFIGAPDPKLSCAVTNHLVEFLAVAEILGLSPPTFYFVEHQRHPTRSGAFVGLSSDHPMIVLVPRQLLAGEGGLFGMYHRVFQTVIHELGHAHMEKVLGLALREDELFVMNFESRYTQAETWKAKDVVLAVFKRLVAKMPVRC